MCMSLRTRDESWTLQERRVYLLDTVRHQRHIEFTYLVIVRLRLAQMSPSMRIQLLVDQDKIIEMRFMMRRLKFPKLHIQMHVMML
jgi:hypothetical protein